MEREQLYSSNVAWKLESSTDHLDDLPRIGYDLVGLNSPAGKDYYCLLDYIDHLNIATPVILYAHSDTVAYTDYPHNDIMWPIMSKRMLDVLCSVKEFPHCLIPIQVMERGMIMEEVNFVGVQLLSYQGYFDWNNSSYKMGRSGRKATRVTKIVLEIPQEGFPPLFRLSAAPTRLFISDQARHALKDAGIRGTRYLPLDSFISQVDLPVVIPTRS